jgi:MerR family transcriptional regulator, light-induced transcriptional regulator
MVPGDDDAVTAALEEALAAHDRAGAVAVALRALDDGAATISGLYEVLSEILVDIGAAWQTGTAEVWQEHLATGIVRTIVEVCAPRVEAAAPRERRATALLAAPDDEYHDLGLRMLADRFALAGWRAHFLGAAVPVDELAAAVDELGADAVALSASTHFHRASLRDYVTRLADAHPGLRIWVGGPAFALRQEDWPEEMLLDPLAVPRPGDD